MTYLNSLNRDTFFAPRERNEDIILMRNPHAKATAGVGGPRAGISFGENITLLVALDANCARMPVIRFFANNKGLRDCPYGWLKKHAQPFDDSTEAKINFETAVRDFCNDMHVTHLALDASEQGVKAKNIDCRHVSWDTQLQALDWLNGEPYDPNPLARMPQSTRLNGSGFRKAILGHRAIDDPWSLLCYFISSQKRRGLDVSDWSDSVTPILALLNAITVTDRFASWCAAIQDEAQEPQRRAERDREEAKRLKAKEKEAAERAEHLAWLASPEHQEEVRLEEEARQRRESEQRIAAKVEHDARIKEEQERRQGIDARRKAWRTAGSIREQLAKCPSSGNVCVEYAHGATQVLSHRLALAAISRGDAILA